jgi:hypothetical protein
MALGIKTGSLGLSATGELAKMTLEAYSDPEFKQKVAGGKFMTAITPKSYMWHYKVEQNKEQGQGTSTTPPGYIRTVPQELDIEIVFDRTGVFKDFPPHEKGVELDLEKFREIIFDYKGENHKPNYIEITWGTLAFQGVLTEMTIEHKLFRPDAAVLRAVAKLKFTQFTKDDLRAAKEKNQSPDLTHYRIVKEGDTLPLMAFDIYGDSRYYLEVAKVNKIANFRKLVIGQQLWFPPIQKQS